MAKGIYKRGNVYWIRYAGLDGKITFESSVSTKFKDAENLIIKRRNAIKEGKQPEIVKRIANHSFNELVAEYVKWCERQKSFRSKRCLVMRLAETFGNVPLRRGTFNIEVQHLGKQKGKCYPKCLWKTNTNI